MKNLFIYAYDIRSKYTRLKFYNMFEIRFIKTAAHPACGCGRPSPGGW